MIFASRAGAFYFEKHQILEMHAPCGDAYIFEAIYDSIYLDIDECYHINYHSPLNLQPSNYLLPGDLMQSILPVEHKELAKMNTKEKEKKIFALKIKLSKAEKQSREGKTRPFREAAPAIINKIVRDSSSSEKHRKS